MTRLLQLLAGEVHVVRDGGWDSTMILEFQSCDRQILPISPRFKHSKSLDPDTPREP